MSLFCSLYLSVSALLSWNQWPEVFIIESCCSADLPRGFTLKAPTLTSQGTGASRRLSLRLPVTRLNICKEAQVRYVTARHKVSLLIARKRGTRIPGEGQQTVWLEPAGNFRFSVDFSVLRVCGNAACLRWNAVVRRTHIEVSIWLTFNNIIVLLQQKIAQLFLFIFCLLGSGCCCWVPCEQLTHGL